MTPRDFIEGQLKTTAFLYEKGLADMSEAEVHAQPFAGANHAVWILMHLAVSEDSMLNQITGCGKKLPAELHEKYQGGSKPMADDPTTRGQAIAAFQASRQRVAAMLAEFPAAEYEANLPEGGSAMFKTKGDYWSLLAAHPYWHFGQLTDVRRAMGKPNVLG